MALVQQKIYEISDRQTAFPGQVYNEAGKVPSQSDPRHYLYTKDYHIPVSPNPTVEALMRDQSWKSRFVDTNIAPRFVTEQLPTPVVDSVTICYKDTNGESGTAVVTANVQVDVNRYAKSTGGIGFDTP